MAKKNIKSNKMVIFLLVVFLILGVGFGVLKSLKKNEEKKDDTVNIVLNEGNLNINYINGDKLFIQDNKKHTYNVSVTNTGEDKLYYSLSLVDVLTSKEFSVVVTDEFGNNCFSDNVSNDETLLSLQMIDGGETKRYSVIVSSNTSMLEATLKVVNDSVSTQTFSDLLLLNNTITVSTTKAANVVATENEGLIPTQDSEGTSYYFRGAVSNNYVKIGNNYFRVVRINGNNSVRLVLNTVLDVSAAYNLNTVSEGENVGNLADLTNATITNVLNNWYEENLTEYKDVIVNGNFCSDNEFLVLSGSFNRSSSYVRVFADANPSYVCNGLTYNGKVGLLSADEVAFAGGAPGQENRSYYLYNEQINGSYFLSSSNYITPDNILKMITVKEDGSLDEGMLVTDMLKVRPVINISVSAKVKGSGTLEDPYTIVA